MGLFPTLLVYPLIIDLSPDTVLYAMRYMYIMFLSMVGVHSDVHIRVEIRSESRIVCFVGAELRGHLRRCEVRVEFSKCLSDPRLMAGHGLDERRLDVVREYRLHICLVPRQPEAQHRFREHANRLDVHPPHENLGVVRSALEHELLLDDFLSVLELFLEHLVLFLAQSVVLVRPDGQPLFPAELEDLALELLKNGQLEQTVLVVHVQDLGRPGNDVRRV
mmetsp:Transcript_1034/g.1777  ORF Transcript_1034/g.1777 Transcript_1034/m.1777 type:complete len:220 (-) Transcript_1034:1305-1964(-)